ncbi:MAG: bis(5'-nucleosyl)-tetraphosphatase (symmetrical) YqeK [Acutalibacteraceae bacterium]
MAESYDYAEYKAILEKRLNPKRYHHSLCVADEALRLAKKYGCDTKKAYLAGLLHDITKNATQEEHLHIFDKFDIMLDSVEKNAEKLWHAISGAAYIEYELGITDKDIITAVRYHTTAREGMSLLEKILYLADYTSADRDYDDVDIMRQKVEISIDAAMDYALTYTINDLVERRKLLHLDTVKAYNENTLKGSLK